MFLQQNIMIIHLSTQFIWCAWLE